MECGLYHNERVWMDLLDYYRVFLVEFYLLHDAGCVLAVWPDSLWSIHISAQQSDAGATATEAYVRSKHVVALLAR